MDKTLRKGLALLEALARAEHPLGLAQIAGTMQLTKSNAHRLLQTLTEIGYVRKSDEWGRYELTTKLWEVGANLLSRFDIKRLAAPHLQTLGELTLENVNLAIFDNGEVLYLDALDSPRAVRAYSPGIGGRAPAFCTATGKALLAFQSEKVIQQAAQNIKRFTSRTIKSSRELKDEMARVRRQGYAINTGEFRDEVRGVAAPIFDAAGTIIAAVGVAGPAERLKPAMLRKNIPLVVSAASAISSLHGHTGKAPEAKFAANIPLKNKK